MYTKYKLKSVALAMACTISLPSLAASEEGFVIEEIVVLAQKRSVGENVQNVPVAITAFDENALD